MIVLPLPGGEDGKRSPLHLLKREACQLFERVVALFNDALGIRYHDSLRDGAVEVRELAGTKFALRQRDRLDRHEAEQRPPPVEKEPGEQRNKRRDGDTEEENDLPHSFRVHRGKPFPRARLQHKRPTEHEEGAQRVKRLRVPFPWKRIRS